MEQSDHVAIRVGGHLGPEWSDRLAGLDITNHDSGEAELSGHVPDQAALFGLLLAIRDLGLPLLSLHRIPHHHPCGDLPCDSSGS